MSESNLKSNQNLAVARQNLAEEPENPCRCLVHHVWPWEYRRVEADIAYCLRIEDTHGAMMLGFQLHPCPEQEAVIRERPWLKLRIADPDAWGELVEAV